ncbi:M20/M25/M40 family metallo-hydrolase [Desulfotalea psychrophila]|uniref:Peptidase M20 dimerisation domain-containing protein n=1 Tax=Desulfotalea psychrophila (strain LSv54 / DSM 12343) TaxID=177439 RepID=Q6ARN8_DESPS|nr:M20/M25/M40 family metallo-hydrolase [Desulfotalea psychrophila]CAG34987.1 conserved hypothetical protein [Desulfotalea psychrophila LSv54]
MNINSERVAQIFTALCEISSPSKNERVIANYLKEIFRELGATEIYEDNSAEQTGSNSGNIIVRFAGSCPERTPLLFACHMDTVLPADNIEVARENDTFTSAGETVLGGDDKSGIVALIEAFTLIKENDTEHGAIELVFTTCEEIGLLGAKYLEYDKLQAKMGYALDAGGSDTVVTRAPTANSIDIIIHGLAAHAGLSPAKGINALTLAAQALAGLQLGRLDADSTANFGLISGGTAVNIVPDKVCLHGEVRSQSPAKLDEYTEKICTVFRKTVADWSSPEHKEQRPSIDIEVIKEYDAIVINEEGPLIQHLLRVTKAMGINIGITSTGGGSDANVFNGHGIETAILATGMDLVHTTAERIDLKDMLKLTNLIYEIISQG